MPLKLTLTAYFTSDSLGLDVCPTFAILADDCEGAAKFLGVLGEKLRDAPDVNAMLTAFTGQRDFPLHAPDWRPMTELEVKEYIELNERERRNNDG